MRAGRLRRRVTIQQQTSTLDSHGQRQDSWTTYATVWAEVVDVAASETVGSATTARIDSLVTVRWQTGITAGMRIVDGSRTLEIVGPPRDPDGRRRTLVVECREVTP